MLRRNDDRETFVRGVFNNRKVNGWHGRFYDARINFLRDHVNHVMRENV